MSVRQFCRDVPAQSNFVLHKPAASGSKLALVMPPLVEQSAARLAADCASKSSMSSTTGAAAAGCCREQQSPSAFEQPCSGLWLTIVLVAALPSSLDDDDDDVDERRRRTRLFMEKFGPAWIKLDVDSVTTKNEKNITLFSFHILRATNLFPYRWTPLWIGSNIFRIVSCSVGAAPDIRQ